MKKILFVIQHYPPKRSANVLCDDKIIKRLSSDGNYHVDYQITCLCYKYPNENLIAKENDVKVIRFKRSLLWNKFVTSVGQNGGIWTRVYKIILRLKQFLTIPIYPFYEPFLCKKFAKQAIKLHKKEKFDMVISEHNGLDTLYAGHKLKEFDPEIKFTAILWDPITGKIPAKYLPKKYAEKKLKKAEFKLLNNADKIIAMKSSESYHLKNSIEKPYFDKFEFLDIPNIYQPKNVSEDEKYIAPNKINVVYSGLLTVPSRMPDGFMEVVAKSKYAESFNLLFFCNGNGKDLLNDYVGKFAGNIAISPYISHDELLKVYKSAQFLLNIGGDNKFMVPSKIFEYMSFGKPIISTYYIEDEASTKYLKKYPLALLIDERLSVEENAKKLDEFIENSLNRTVPFEFVKETFKENTTDAYISIIESLLN